MTTGEAILRDVTEADLQAFFDHQEDPVAYRMAAFSPRDREAFMVHWRTRILGDATVLKKTILYRDQVAGNIVCFEQAGRWLVGYWIGRPFWGQGVATAALSQLIKLATMRPLHAFVARQNAGSIRVLQKCGFTRSEEELDAAVGVDGETIEELLFVLAD